MKTNLARKKGSRAEIWDLSLPCEQRLEVDIDGLAEAVDCFRCCGLTDANDPQVCTASVHLLSLLDKGSGGSELKCFHFDFD